MKVKVLLFLLILIELLNAEILVVNHNGTGDFNSIQQAVDMCAAGDTILVYNGIYQENINIISKSLSICSMNLFSNDTLDVINTVIDANQMSGCFHVSESDSVLIQGFTMTNGIGFDLTNIPGIRIGGAIYFKDSYVILKDNIIKNNVAFDGAGLDIENTKLILSGNQIYENHAFGYGGGLFFYNCDDITFDQENLNSVYFNTARNGNDFFLLASNVSIYLQKFTVLDYDNTFISLSPQVAPSHYEFHCLEQAVEPVNHDLYVSPYGDNNNSGLSFAEPLKHISWALIKIKSDSTSPHTIHLSNGIYSPSTNNDYYPLNLRSYVSIVGESEEGTIFDGEENDYMLMAGKNAEIDVTLKNFTIRNFKLGSLNYSPIMVSDDCANCDTTAGAVFHFENIKFENITPYTDEDGPNAITFCHSAPTSTFKNIKIHDSMLYFAIGIAGRNNIMENIQIKNIHSFNESEEFCTGGGIIFANPAPTQGQVNKVVNLEISNSENTMTTWPRSSVFYIVSRNAAIVSNATIVNNTCQNGYGGAITIEAASLTLLNSIIYNNTPYPIQMYYDQVFGTADLNIYNSLLTDGRDGIILNGNCNLNYDDATNIDQDPLFVGNGEYPFSLSSESPCIDGGTLDLPDGIELPETDLAGNPRVVGASVDMGAYEYQGNDESQENQIISPQKTEINIYPNPFELSKSGIKSSVKIRLTLKEAGNIKLVAYNLKGQKVKTLIDAYSGAGEFTCKWDVKSEHIASGVYFIKLMQDGKNTKVKKMMVVK